MKNNPLSTIAAITLAGILSAGTASAMGLDSGTRPLDSVVGVNSTSLSYNVRDGVATLFGNTDSSTEATLAENHIKNIAGVDRVINLVTYN